MLFYIAIVAIANLALGYFAGIAVARRIAQRASNGPTYRPTIPYEADEMRSAVERRSEPATEVVNRAAVEDASNDSSPGAQPETIETAIENFWRADPYRQRDLALAMIDVDGCEQLNAEYGPAAVDEALETIASLLVDPTSHRSLTVWHGGQRFVILLADWVANDATDALEHIRRTIEETEFQHFGQILNVTVCCSVATSLKDDTTGTLLDRLNDSLKAAKQQGRNRTFLHTGHEPLLVESGAALTVR